MLYAIKRYSLSFIPVSLAMVALAPSAHAESMTDGVTSSIAPAMVASASIAVAPPTAIEPLDFDLANTLGSTTENGELISTDEVLLDQSNPYGFAAQGINPLNRVPQPTNTVPAHRKGTGLDIVNSNKAEFGEINSDVSGATSRVRTQNRNASIRFKL